MHKYRAKQITKFQYNSLICFISIRHLLLIYKDCVYTSFTCFLAMNSRKEKFYSYFRSSFFEYADCHQYLVMQHTSRRLNLI